MFASCDFPVRGNIRAYNARVFECCPYVTPCNACRGEAQEKSALSKIAALVCIGGWRSRRGLKTSPAPQRASRSNTLKNAEPDGSVMLFTPDFPITVYPHSFRSLSYDPLRDFTAVSPAARSMLTYNVGPAVP